MKRGSGALKSVILLGGALSHRRHYGKRSEAAGDHFEEMRWPEACTVRATLTAEFAILSRANWSGNRSYVHELQL